jgi:hypothetical protein
VNKSHFHVPDHEDDSDDKAVGEARSFKVLILPAVFETTKVSELSNSHTVGPGTNFVRLPHSLDIAGRLKAVSLPLSRLLELLGTLARLHRAVRNTFSPFLTIIMAKSCLHLLLGTVYVKPSHTCIYRIKWCQPKCPDRSPLLWPLTVISDSCFWEPRFIRSNATDARWPAATESLDRRLFYHNNFSSFLLE